MKILNTIFLICAFSTVSFAQMSIDLGVSHANLKGDFYSDINNLLGKKGPTLELINHYSNLHL